ncbi:FG-GAP-like repeat-containing protein [Crystallibacter crystallopoietes]|uniref:FG-GAP-like repeat-containing protein n=1 Tax=Crystallibacter crystallopoietes TaxID=37928 RepID=UPI001ED9A936|nr:FG-GAP-like repeat-containing protein [Arthrobacter crystallopoietes]
MPEPSPTPTPAPEPDNSFLTAAAQDLDLDSHADLLSRRSDGTLWFHSGNGAGGYAAATQIGSGWDIFDQLAGAGTFDGDGYPDLLARRTDGSLWLYPGAEGAAYAPAVQLADSGWDSFDTILGPGDLDGDGAHDLLARQPDGSVYLYPGDGTGNLAPRVLVATGWQEFDHLTSAGDFSGDGKADVVGRKPDGTLWLLRSTGSEADGGGLFAEAEMIGTGGWQAFSSVLAAGDNNGDGKNDLVAVYPDRSLRFYAGTAFSESEGYLRGTRTGDPVWDAYTLMAAPGDFNGDGKADLLATRPDGTLGFAAGDGEGSYGSRISIGTGWQIYDKLLGAGDYDGDGSNDLIARQRDGSLWFYAGTGRIGGGDEGYERRVKIGNSGWGQFLHLEAPGDVNRDGNNDLLAVARDGTVYLYAGPGTGTSHGPRAVAGSGWNAYTAVVPVGDYDGGGTGDIVLRKPDGSLWLRTGLASFSDGWFSQERRIGSGGWNGFNRILGPGDFNSDAKVDMFATRPDGTAFFYAGTRFSRPEAVEPGVPAGNL